MVLIEREGVSAHTTERKQIKRNRGCRPSPPYIPHQRRCQIKPRAAHRRCPTATSTPHKSSDVFLVFPAEPLLPRSHPERPYFGGRFFCFPDVPQNTDCHQGNHRGARRDWKQLNSTIGTDKQTALPTPPPASRVWGGGRGGGWGVGGGPSWVWDLCRSCHLLPTNSPSWHVIVPIAAAGGSRKQKKTGSIDINDQFI